MADWYFYDQNGYKIGPIKGRELKQSAQQGLITPETVVEDENGRTALAKQVTGLTFGETAQPKVVPQVSDNPSTIAAPLPPDKPIPVPLPTANAKVDVANLTAKGKELTQQGKETISKGMSDVMGGLSAVKAAAQARLKLNALNAQLVTAFRALGDAAIQAGWGGELCEAISKQKEEVAIATAQHSKTTTDAELAKNTPGAGAAKQALSEAKARMSLAAGILDGLREKAGRTLLSDTSAPSHIGTEQRAEIARLLGEFALCESIIAQGKKSLVSKPMLVAAGLLLLVGVIAFFVYAGSPFSPGGHPFKNAKPGDWARYDATVSAEGKTETGTLLLEVISNDGRKVRLQMTATGPNQWGREEVQKNEMEIDLLKSKSDFEIALSELRKHIPPDALKNMKVQKGKTTTETVSVSGQTFNCTVTPETFTATITKPDGETNEITSVSKTWTSKNVFLDGTVKQETDIMFITKMKTEKIRMTRTLVAFGSGSR